MRTKIIGKNLDCLYQIFEKPIWDGDLISKYYRDKFVECGLVSRDSMGFNRITPLGIKVVEALGIEWIFDETDV